MRQFGLDDLGRREMNRIVGSVREQGKFQRSSMWFHKKFCCQLSSLKRLPLDRWRCQPGRIRASPRLRTDRTQICGTVEKSNPNTQIFYLTTIGILCTNVPMMVFECEWVIQNMRRKISTYSVTFLSNSDLSNVASTSIHSSHDFTTSWDNVNDGVVDEHICINWNTNNIE